MDNHDQTQERILKALKELIDIKKHLAFVPEYRDQAKETEALGILISQYFEWDGSKIVETFIEALGDANFHSLAGEIQELADKDFNRGGQNEVR